MARILFSLASVFVSAHALFAQAGLTPAWEVKKTLDELATQTRRLGPIVNEIRAQEWVANGAPAGYAEQAKSVRNEVDYLIRTSAQLAKEPEKMTLALDTYIRLETLDTMMNSLSEGVRKYQNPALADLIQGILGENDAQRAKLRNYVTELISTKETELRIMNDEAQRCRGMVLRQPKPVERKQTPK
jgi:hypothetical protein